MTGLHDTTYGQISPLRLETNNAMTSEREGDEDRNVQRYLLGRGSPECHDRVTTAGVAGYCCSRRPIIGRAKC